MENPDSLPSFSESFRVWLKIALHSFGGPAGQIAVMHQYLVEEKKWLGENRFLHALHYCMLLPGPEAQQLITYIGWLMYKTRGGIVAGALFVLPGFLSMLVLSIVYALWKDVAFVQGLFYGIKPAVLAIVVGAVVKIGRKALKNEAMAGIAVLSFVAIFAYQVSFPFIIAVAGLIGYLGVKFWPEMFLVNKRAEDTLGEEEGLIDRLVPSTIPRFSKTVATAAFWLAMWVLPTLLLLAFFGMDNIFTRESIFFSKSAAVTFGGAYSVLAYISQQAVEAFGWLQPGEMLDGLGMAETTPGPLIQVVQFVGFLGAFRNPGAIDPLLAGVLASILVTWVTFLPSFLFIFTGAPYMEYLRGNKNLTSALSGVTAAVVGVILNLGIWFSLHTLFGQVAEQKMAGMHLPLPVWTTVDWGSVLLTLVALFIYFKFQGNMVKTLVVCGVSGLLFYGFKY